MKNHFDKLFKACETMEIHINKLKLLGDKINHMVVSNPKIQASVDIWNNQIKVVDITNHSQMENLILQLEKIIKEFEITGDNHE